MCDLETSRMGAPYIYDISHLRVNVLYPQAGIRNNVLVSASRPEIHVNLIELKAKEKRFK